MGLQIWRWHDKTNMEWANYITVLSFQVHIGLAVLGEVCHQPQIHSATWQQMKNATGVRKNCLQYQAKQDWFIQSDTATEIMSAGWSPSRIMWRDKRQDRLTPEKLPVKYLKFDYLLLFGLYKLFILHNTINVFFAILMFIYMANMVNLVLLVSTELSEWRRENIYSLPEY